MLTFLSLFGHGLGFSTNCMLGNFTSKVQPHSSRDFTAGVGVLLVYFLVVLYHTTAVGLTTVYYWTFAKHAQ